MLKKILLGAFGATLLSVSLFPVSADTLDTVKSRGRLKCGVNVALAGFSQPDSNGVWTGIDVDVCRAIAAAVFGDPSKVDYTPLSAQQRFTAIQSGEVDVLSRNTTVNFQREASLGLLFAQPTYYDGQGFIVKKSKRITRATALNNATVCVQPGTTTETNLAAFARNNKLKIKPVLIEKFDDSVAAYMANRCDAYTTDLSGLAAIRATSSNPAEHVLLPEVISKEPLAAAVRQGDDKWYNIVNWTIRALIQAEELGITKANADEMKKSDNVYVKKFLDSDVAPSLGLPRDFAFKIVKAGGNYGEIFEANLGKDSKLKLARGLNNLWTKGGLQFSPPF